MILPAACLLYTQDPDFVRRARAYLRSTTRLQHVAQSDRLDTVLQQNRPALLLLDLRGKETVARIAQVQAQWPDVLIIGFGTLRSEPLHEAAQSGIYAAEDVNLEQRHFQALVGRALDHLQVLEENRAMRAASARLPAFAPARHLPEVSHESRRAPMAMAPSPRGLRRFERSELLVSRVVEDLAGTVRVARVGMFGHSRPGEPFRLRAGQRVRVIQAAH